MQDITLTIDRLVFGGEGLGYYNGRPVFTAGVLPFEEVLVRPIRIKTKFIKAGLIKVIKPSPLRINPKEDHALSCSPWQILPYSEQLKYKKDLTEAVFTKFAKELPSQDPKIFASPEEWGYRNKLEFGFCLNEQDLLSLAFNKRYTFQSFYAFDECLLGHFKLNLCAKEIIKVLHQQNISIDSLKNLLVRYSYFEDKCLAVLFVTNKNFPKIEIKLPNLSGWLIVYSNPQSPVASTEAILFQQGSDKLKEKIGDCVLEYYYDSFFQINPPAFNQVIKSLSESLDSEGELVDLYAGVGTIGLCFAKKFNKLYSLEADAKASQIASSNAVFNQLPNVEIACSLAGNYDLTSFIKSESAVIVDPPRAGLEPKVVKSLLELRPKFLAYLSCNPATQARDWFLLKESYQVVKWQLFDFYPQTPHIESLLILRRNN
ncbi:MAG: 23S rRNA (uracil(1939)-C(5))-methyltransferase RlmD [Patescibacteria group bacterium]|jgi:23S rRNA (uracil1939-C5)-methyltransferase